MDFDQAEGEVSAFSAYQKRPKKSSDKKSKEPKLSKTLKRNKKQKLPLSKAVKSLSVDEALTLGELVPNGVEKKRNKNRKNKLNVSGESGKVVSSRSSDEEIVESSFDLLTEKSKKKTLSGNKKKYPQENGSPRIEKPKASKRQNKKKKNSSISETSRSSIAEDVVVTDSIEEGKDLFAWLIAPYPVDDFFKNIWEKKPLHVKRDQKGFYGGIISTPIIDNMLRTEEIMFTKNIDITSYVDGRRDTHNPSGRALPHVVWDYYLNGCSVRLLNPQTYILKLQLLNATLQEYFHCFVGANSYLTPPNSQGFAPHYDDIEAFILQVEGKKLWKLYNPISDEETLPRVSSKNFDQAEIGEPVMEVMLEPGDLLYFPRGFIHQGSTPGDDHSLHVTISCYQKQSWADLFEKLLPQALDSAIREDVNFREGLPLDMSRHLGLVHSDSDTPRRNELIDKVKDLFHKIVDHMAIDDAVDQISKKYIEDALPPVLNVKETDLTVYGGSDKMIRNGEVINRVEIQLDTKIRLLRANIIRMVMEEETIRLYYYVENSKEYHGNELQYLEISEDLAPGIETLITTYPEYVSVENLDAPLDSDKLQIATDLWEKGIIMTESPLDFIE